METLKYFTVDKGDWGRGPWDSEPDKMQFRDEGTGLPCLIVRGPSGALCGYVGVPENHCCYGMKYSEEHWLMESLEVHGGLTFSDFCDEDGGEDVAICHIPGEGEPAKVWWLGFDCAHLGDQTPGFNTNVIREFLGDSPLFGSGEYRTIEYVTNEIVALAAQLDGDPS